MDINNFGPFHFEVWGAVSDWIMVIVTTLTAIFLYYSLKSQRAVQKMQQSITVIQLNEYLLKIRPDFECSMNWLDMDGHYYRARIKIKILDNIPYNLTYSFKQVSNDFEDISGHKGMIDAQSNQIGTERTIIIKLKDLAHPRGLVGSLDLQYEDAIGTKYLCNFGLFTIDPDILKAGPMVKEFPIFMQSNELSNHMRSQKHN